VDIPRVFPQPFHQPAAGDAKLLGRSFEREAHAVHSLALSLWRTGSEGGAGVVSNRGRLQAQVGSVAP
jgi:hypothetical protein